MQFLQSELCKYISTILKILGNTLVFYHFIADIDHILNKILCAYSRIINSSSTIINYCCYRIDGMSYFIHIFLQDICFLNEFIHCILYI